MDFYCLVSAAFFVTRNAMRIAFDRLRYNRNFDWEGYKEFDAEVIEAEWGWMMDHHVRTRKPTVITVALKRSDPFSN